MTELNVNREDVQALESIANRLAVVIPAADELLASAAGRCITITFCNPLAVRVARRFPGYLADLSQCDYLFADGILLARLASRLRGENIPRVSFDGNSLAPAIFAAAARRDVAVALVGGGDGVAARAAVTLQSAYGARHVLQHHGFLDDTQVGDVIARIRASGAGLVVAGMGAGVQERFMLKLRDSGWHGLAVSCGGYLDQLASAGRVRYYPNWVNALHLRAPWRVLHEPGRLLPRYSIEYLPFYRAACALVLAGRKS